MEQDLEQFVSTQNEYGRYSATLKEIESGHKVSHWIWYVFPQLKGLGHSYNLQYYELAGEAEAKAYLAHPLLGARLREITAALLTHSDESAEELMGSPIDATKLRSCMTLFDAIAPGDTFARVLSTFYGGRRCRRTLAKLNQANAAI